MNNWMQNSRILGYSVSDMPQLLRPGFHIIVRIHKRDADSLRPSASVSRLTCFHIVIRNRKGRKESATQAMIQSRLSLGKEPREVW